MEPPSISDMFTRWKNETNQPLTDRLATLDMRSQAIATSGDYMQVLSRVLFHSYSVKEVWIFSHHSSKDKEGAASWSSYNSKC